MDHFCSLFLNNCTMRASLHSGGTSSVCIGLLKICANNASPISFFTSEGSQRRPSSAKSMMHFPSISIQLINSPYFRSIFFFSYVFSFPYFDNDAFMHHALYILDAPEGSCMIFIHII